MRVFASKTEHDSRGGHRICSLFRELIPYFGAVRPADAREGTLCLRSSEVQI